MFNDIDTNVNYLCIPFFLFAFLFLVISFSYLIIVNESFIQLIDLLNELLINP